MKSEGSSEKSFDKIFRFDKKIRYCGVIDGKGNLIAGTLRKGLTSLEPENEDRKLFAQLAIGMDMAWDWSRYFGKTTCIVILQEKVVFFLFPLSDQRAIVLVTESDLSVSKMRRLGELIDISDWPSGNPPK